LAGFPELIIARQLAPSPESWLLPDPEYRPDLGGRRFGGPPDSAPHRPAPKPRRPRRPAPPAACVRACPDIAGQGPGSATMCSSAPYRPRICTWSPRPSRPAHASAPRPTRAFVSTRLAPS